MSNFDPRYREDRVSSNLTIALYRISQAMTLLMRERGLAHGLSLAQLQALLFLAHARPGVHTIGGLAQRLGCSPANASVVADALERKGLATRVPRSKNRRIITLNLTDNGAAKAIQVDNSLDEFETIVRELSQEEQMMVLRAMRRIVQGLADRGRITIYGICLKCDFLRPGAYSDGPSGVYRCALMDVSLTDADVYLECPDFVPREET